jgi:hypothetical protein
MTGLWRLRAAVLTLVGALAVHELRYLLAPPVQGHEVAAAHGYLPWLIAGVGALAFVLASQLAVRLAGEGDEGAQLPRMRSLWLGASVALLGVFVTQELAELALSHGHMAELLQALGSGAWVAIPLAIACGAIIALLLKGAAAVVEWVLQRTARRPRRAVPAARRPRALAPAPRGSVLARRLAGRAPPALS